MVRIVAGLVLLAGIIMGCLHWIEVWWKNRKISEKESELAALDIEDEFVGLEAKAEARRQEIEQKRKKETPTS